MRIANLETDADQQDEEAAPKAVSEVSLASEPTHEEAAPKAVSEVSIASEPPNEETAAKTVGGVRVASDSLRVFAIGFLLAAAFFLIEAGAAEIVLARRSDCVEQLGRMRLAPNPEQACMSEFQFFLARAVSRGVFVSADPEPSGAIAWPLMAGLYGLMGGALARMKPTRGIGVYLGVHLAVLMVLMSLDFLSQFIV